MLTGEKIIMILDCSFTNLAAAAAVNEMFWRESKSLEDMRTMLVISCCSFAMNGLILRRWLYSVRWFDSPQKPRVAVVWTGNAFRRQMNIFMNIPLFTSEQRGIFFIVFFDVHR